MCSCSCVSLQGLCVSEDLDPEERLPLHCIDGHDVPRQANAVGQSPVSGCSTSVWMDEWVGRQWVWFVPIPVAKFCVHGVDWSGSLHCRGENGPSGYAIIPEGPNKTKLIWINDINAKVRRFLSQSHFFLSFFPSFPPHVFPPSSSCPVFHPFFLPFCSSTHLFSTVPLPTFLSL